MCQFSVKTDNSEFFGLNLGKLPNYVRYFGSYNVESVVGSWVEAEMSWVEVDGAEWSWVKVGARFSNTHEKLNSYCLTQESSILKVHKIHRKIGISLVYLYMFVSGGKIWQFFGKIFVRNNFMTPWLYYKVSSIEQLLWSM